MDANAPGHSTTDIRTDSDGQMMASPNGSARQPDIASTSLCNATGTHTAFTPEEMRRNGHFTDVVLEADDGAKFPAHKIVLAACSRYFRAAFTEDFVEKSGTTMKLIGINSNTLRQLVQFTYMRKVDDLNSDTAQDLLTWADFFTIPALVHLCCHFMVRHMTTRNCMGIFRMARHYNFDDLAQQAQLFGVKHFEQVARKSDDLRLFNTEDLISLIKSDQLNVENESTVWRAVERWLEYDPENRRSAAPAVLQHIRLCLLDKNTLDAVRCSPHIQSNVECRDMLGNALKRVYKFPPYNDNTLSSVECKWDEHRYPGQLLFALGGWVGGVPTGVTEAYDSKTGQWTLVQVHEPSAARAYHGAVAKGGQLWMLGGYDGRNYFSSMSRFDFATKTWSERAPMHHRRCYVSVVLHKGYIWALGGYNGLQRMSSVERYDFAANQWSMVTPLMATRSDAHATVCADHTYITGGFTGVDYLDTVEYYDANRDRWMSATAMRRKRGGVACVTLGGVVYVVGGYNGLGRQRSCERFDPRVGRWEDVANMNGGRSNFGIECVNGKIIVAGGFNGDSVVNDCECYEPRTNTWSKTLSMLVSRSGLHCVAVDQIPDMRGYLPANRSNSTFPVL